METLSQLDLSTITRFLNTDGLRFSSGPFTISLTSRLPQLSRHMSRLYADNPLSGSSEFIDFHVSVQRPSGLRRWIRPQVVFAFDGFEPFSALPLAQASAQFEWGLNWCIAGQSHQYLIIHSAVVEKNGVSLIMPGAPGSGKSTLCAGLVSHGWRLLSDEMALISLQTLHIQPVPRPISLKNRSIQIIREYAPDSVMGEVVQGTTKGDVIHMRAPLESVRRQHETAAPGFIIFPRYAEDATTQLQEIPSAEACMKLIENSFNFNILGERGFDAATRVIDNTRSFHFSYPDLDQAIDALLQLVNA